MALTWEDIRGLFALLTSEEQQRFTDFLFALQDIEDSEQPQTSNYQKES